MKGQGKGSGWKGESRRHSLARKGVSTNIDGDRRFDVSNFVARGKFPEADISRHNWSFKLNPDGTMKLSLGNWTDAGWFWSGDESELGGFLIRINSSKVKDEFIADMKEAGITFEMLMPILLEHINDEEGNGMYSLTGDNNRWKFGYGWEFETGDELENLASIYNITEDDFSEIEDEYSFHTITGKSVDIDEFEKSDKYGEIKSKLVHEIKTSYDFDDYFTNLDNLDESIAYDMAEWDDEINREEFDQAFVNWSAKKKKEGREIGFKPKIKRIEEDKMGDMFRDGVVK